MNAFVPLATQVPVLDVQRIGFSYTPEARIFDDISLSIQPSEIVVLLGGSGCGKSSLLKVLAGLQAPSAGQVSFSGQAMAKPHPRSALIFQQASLLPWLRVEDNIGFGLDFKQQPNLSRKLHRERVSEALTAVGLQHRKRAWPSELSGGQAQRIALARALAKQPELLFADEPFSALDAITRTEMQQLLVSLVRRWNTAVLLVTHDIDEAIAVADRIILMGGQPGKIVQQWQVPLQHPRTEHAAAALSLRQDILGYLNRTVSVQ